MIVVTASFLKSSVLRKLRFQNSSDAAYCGPYQRCSKESQGRISKTHFRWTVACEQAHVGAQARAA